MMKQMKASQVTLSGPNTLNARMLISNLQCSAMVCGHTSLILPHLMQAENQAHAHHTHNTLRLPHLNNLRGLIPVIVPHPENYVMLTL